MLPAVDHLVYAVPDLESGMDHVERLLGKRPVPGGRHPQVGTHNALLGLGGECYLELIAADPEAETPTNGYMFGVEPGMAPRLITWALRDERIHQTVQRLATQGLDLGPVFPGHRRTAEGIDLHWELSNPFLMACNGAVPFLIAWGDTPHPALDLPVAGELQSLVVAHPDELKLQSKFELMGLQIEVVEKADYAFSAWVATAVGVVQL